MYSKLNNIVVHILSDELKNNDKNFMQAKLLTRFILLCITASIIFLLVYYFINLTLSFYSVLVFTIIFISTQLSLKFAKHTLIQTKVVIVSCYAIILAIAIDSGGSQSPVIPIFIIIPIISFLLGSKKDGFLFTSLTVITILSLYSLSYLGIAIRSNIDSQYEATYELVFNMFTFLFIILMILNYDKELSTSHIELKKTVKKLQASEIVMKEISEQAINFSKYLGEAEEELQTALQKEKEAKKKLQQTQTQLVQNEKMASIGLLTAGIAHEINNPVNFIQTGIIGLNRNLKDIKEFDNIISTSLSEILKKVESNDIQDPLTIIKSKIQKIENARKELAYNDACDEIDELVNSIKNGANRTAEIVLGLRTFSRLDEHEWKSTDLESNIDSTLVLLKNKYKDKVEIIKEYGKIPNVECYPGKLNQVFMNLLVNAIQAIPEVGKINIKTECLDDKTVRVSIADTGTGIPKSLQEKIYDPFFTTKSVGEGTGLGLAITKSIIEDHNAKLTFDTIENKGTIFYIDIPIIQSTKKENHE